MKNNQGHGFESFWMIPSLSRLMFENNNNPTITVDGCFTCYPDLKLLVAVMQDGNGKLQLIAAGLCFGETKENYTTLFRLLKEKVVGDKSVSIVSDRASSIRSAYLEVFDEQDQHVACSHHLVNNVKTWLREEKLDNNKVIRCVKKMINTCQVDEFNQAQDTLKSFALSIYDQLTKVDQIWARIHLKEHIFGVLTSNAAEIINSMLKRKMDWDECIRDCHIVYMIVGIYGIIKSQVEKRREAVDKAISNYNSEYLVTDYVVTKVRSYKKQFNYSQWKLSDNKDIVYFKKSSYVVDLLKRQCTCGRYQEYGYPCIHAYAFIRLTSNDFYNSMTNMVDPYYLVSTVEKTCEFMMPNSPEISIEAVEAFSEGFNEETCPAVETTSIRYTYGVSDVPVIQQKISTHLASQGKKGGERKGENAERARRTTEKKGGKHVPELPVVTETPKTQNTKETKKTKGTKRPKNYEEFEEFNNNNNRVWLEADDEYIIVSVDEKEDEDKLVFDELNEAIPPSQPHIHLLKKKRLKKRRLSDVEQKKGKQSISQGCRTRNINVKKRS